jgi:hypothetical protein
MCFYPLFLHYQKGELPEEYVLDDEAPETTTRQDGDKIEEATEKTDYTSVSPPSISSKGAEKWWQSERILWDD